MIILRLKNISVLVVVVIFMALLGGCNGLVSRIPADPLALAPTDRDRLGEAVEARMVQMLGGPYYDLTLPAALKRACLEQTSGKAPCRITVTDQSLPALYPLPGGRILLSRGLLADISDGDELASLLEKSVALSEKVYTDHSTREMNEAVTSQLADAASGYDPDAADIRLARFFMKDACEKDCLQLQRAERISESASTPLPVPVKRLASLQSGYKLLREAREFEKQGDEAQSIARYLQAATEAPDEPRILKALGMAYLRAGQFQPARLHLQNAVKLQPGYYRSRMGLGYLALKKGSLRQASEELEESVKLLPVIDNLFLLAESREKSGDINAALTLYKIIVKSDPGSQLGRSSARRLAQAGGDQ